VSTAKLSRFAASSLMRPSITRPASIATRSGENPESPRAITSAFTNSVTPSAPRNRREAAVDLPAPLGPARTTTFGDFRGFMPYPPPDAILRCLDRIDHPKQGPRERHGTLTRRLKSPARSKTPTDTASVGKPHKT